jgi:hypothetical protein
MEEEEKAKKGKEGEERRLRERPVATGVLRIEVKSS